MKYHFASFRHSASDIAGFSMLITRPVRGEPMRSAASFLILAFAVLSSQTVAAQQHPSPTVADSLNYIWKDVQQDFTALAEAMPEDKWSFKPTQGAFTNARTFAEQVKHVACANEAWARKLRDEKPPGRCDTGGPNPAKTKAEIMVYLRESFSMMNAGIADTNAENLLAPLHGPYAGDNRLEVVTSALWHLSDHYGQLVEYARMNGVVPPASR
jgi:DinB superfamily